MNIKKKAFTLSEALVTLAILGVLAAILIPVLDNVRPDKDKIMYKKAMYAMQGAVSSAMDEISAVATNTSAYWADDLIGNSDFCRKVASSLNLQGTDRCFESDQSWENAAEHATNIRNNEPDFKTTDGIMWWGLSKYKFGRYHIPGSDGDTANNDIHNIYVTRKDQYNDDGTMKADSTPLKIQVRYDGRVGTGDGSTWSTENEYLEDSMNISKGNR